MTIGLQITDGTTTLDLNDGSYFEIIELDLGYGAIGADRVQGSVRLYIDGTKAQCQTEIAALEKLLQQAVDYSGTGQGNALYSSLDKIVYLQYRTDSTETYYRSPILNANPGIEPGSMETLNFDCGGVEYYFDFERRNWWESTSETQVPVSTSAVARTTNAVTLYNPWNNAAGAYQHYAHIDCADVLGNLPAATRIEITNTYNNANGLSFIWIGQNFTRPDDFISVIEAEDAVGVTPVAAVGGASHDAYVTQSLANGSEGDLLTWQLTANDLSFAAGRWYKALLRFQIEANSTFAQYRLQLEYNSIAIWKGPLVSLDTNYSLAIRDILTFQMPPSLAGLANLGALDLVLRGYQTTGAAIDLKIDCLILLPVDGYRLINGVLGAAEYNRRVIDDGITPILYEDDGSGAGRIPTWIGYSTPIMLQPNRTQRLYFITHSEAGGTAPIVQTISVKIYYRQRRLSI